MQNNKLTLSSIDKQCLLALSSNNPIISMPIEKSVKEAELQHALIWPFWIARGYVQSHDLAESLAKILDINYATNEDFSLSSFTNINKPYLSWIKTHPTCFVLDEDDDALILAISSPIAPELISQWSLQCKKKIHLTVVNYTVAEKMISSILFQEAYSRCIMPKTIKEDAISQCCQALLMEAITQGVTDIHGEPGPHHFIVRFRIQGILKMYCTFPPAISKNITNRLKVMSQRDLSINRLPQDGHLTILGHARGVRDARINFCPVIHGEKWVIRLLNTQQRKPHIRYLDLNKQDMARMQHAINQPQGLILVTGPTGSGKTSTLYALLETLNQPGVNISTIEDPVEQHLANINQIDVKPSTGLTFAVGLRALLRQDPDILMIGEIRDKETAAIALNAAQTGHLVFATLHSNSTSHTIARLLSMGFHPEQLSHTLLCIVAQRLVRLLCQDCHHNKQQSCSACHGGYKERMAIYEIMTIDHHLRQLIEYMPFDLEALEQQACKQGMTTLSEGGQLLIKQGMTDQQEIERVLCH